MRTKNPNTRKKHKTAATKNEGGSEGWRAGFGRVRDRTRRRGRGRARASVVDWRRRDNPGAMDPAMLDGFPEEDKAKMMGMIEQMQTRDSLRMYNNLVERCFMTCVQSFRRKTLEKDEERCVSKCCEKFLKHSARASVRFGELNAQSMQGMQGGPPAS